LSASIISSTSEALPPVPIIVRRGLTKIYSAGKSIRRD
jgi:hypothetical protein